jgi:hypothetical protein
MSSARRRRRAQRRTPTSPPGLDRLRDARDVIDPGAVYVMALDDGSALIVPGASLLETTSAFAAMVDAVRAGDQSRARAALGRIEAPASALVLCTRVGQAPHVPPGAEIENCRDCGHPVWLCRETRDRTAGFSRIILCTECVREAHR